MIIFLNFVRSLMNIKIIFFWDNIPEIATFVEISDSEDDKNLCIYFKIFYLF